MPHHNRKSNSVRIGGKVMAKGQNAQENVEETQGGAEQPQASETEQPAQAAAAPTSTAVEEVKRTPAVIAQTNIEKADQLRTQHADALAARGNNMSDKIR